MKNIFSFILAMYQIIKVGVGGFSHLAFKKIKVVLNSLKKTVTSVLENKTLGTRLGVFICLIVLLMASGKKGNKCKLVEPYNSYGQTSLIWHQRDRTKCPLYRDVGIIEVGNVWFLAFLGPNELSVIERCPYYRGVRKERLDCSCQLNTFKTFSE